MVVGETIYDYVNIGDFIQALAARQFFPQIDAYIERERLGEYEGENVRMIMNGWYMYNQQQWPPSRLINPLFVSFHINKIARGFMLNETSLAYLKEYAPIGCRDKETMNCLKERGVDAYFSGCLTLTLGKTYKSEECDKKIYFVDPIVTFLNKRDKWLYAIKGLMKFSIVYKLYRKWNWTSSDFLMKWSRVSKFYSVYSKLFYVDDLVNAEYICQQNEDWKEKYRTSEERLNAAEGLILKYAKAAMVVTSRIHCALPCLGLETPVLYVYSGVQDELSSCRFDGLKELFNVIYWDGRKLTNEWGFSMNNRISASNCPKNKENWKVYAEKLIQRCSDFVS